MPTVFLGKEPLSIAALAGLARGDGAVGLDETALSQIGQGRALLERFLAEDRPVYGLTRGLGARAVTAVDPAEREEMSHIMLRARACGAGPLFGDEPVRAFLLARLASLCTGRSGVRPVVAETLATMLNAGVHPAVHEIGAHGASDMPLLAEMALPVMGEGRAFYRGQLLPGGEAMQAAGVAPLSLKEKEGQGLCSASSLSAGLGALVLDEAWRLLHLAEAIAVLSFEAFRANLSPLDPRVAALHPAPGQAEAAARLRRLLAGSGLSDPGAARRLQDPISLRCASHAFAGLRNALAYAEPQVLAEINGSGDNPVMLFEEGEILSTGNFQTIGLAQAFDLLAIALSTAASMGAQRTAKLMRKTYSDLPDGLSPLSEGSVRIGMGLIGHTARHLAKEMRNLAQPASLDDASGYEVEDHEPMTPLAVRKTWRQLPLWRQTLAAELIVAAEAFDQRQVERPAAVAQALRDAVRDLVPRQQDDRSHSVDIETVDAFLTNRTLTQPLLQQGEGSGEQSEADRASLEYD
ncbi:MAG: aromatic amino acid ammonia-lyase [Pseudomonadota bacterium]